MSPLKLGFGLRVTLGCWGVVLCECPNCPLEGKLKVLPWGGPIADHKPAARETAHRLKTMKSERTKEERLGCG